MMTLKTKFLYAIRLVSAVIILTYSIGCKNSNELDVSNRKILAGEITTLQNTNNGYHPKWSPDGSQIAYTVWNDNPIGMKIYVWNESTSTSVPVIEGMRGDFAFSWSRDGKKIVFDAYNSSGRSQIWLKDLESGNITQLTHHYGNSFMPDYSPKEDKILFHYSGRLAVMDLTNNTTTNIPNTENGYHPSWSFDGRKILFSLETNGLNISDLFIVNLDGSNKQQITDYSGRDDRARWSPDGRFIAYDKYDGDDVDIAIYEVETGLKYNLTENGTGRMPDWSPDGKSLVFVDGQVLKKMDLIFQ